MLKGLLPELIFGSIGAGVPTYIRNDNSDAAYRVDYANSATNGNGYAVSREQLGGLGNNEWLISCYITGIQILQMG